MTDTSAEGPELALSRVCHVCHRDVVHTRPGAVVSAMACARCLRIDEHLGVQYGVLLLTPLDDSWATGRQVMAHRLRSGTTAVEWRERLLHHHVRHVQALSDRAVANGAPTMLLHRPGSPRWQLWLRWEEWVLRFPASVRASVTGYQRYVESVHPWVDSVEPRVADVAWLTALAER